jgi:hypothetical protein
LIAGIGATPIIFRQGVNGYAIPQVPEIQGIGNPQGSPELSLINGVGCASTMDEGLSGLYDNYS